MKEWVVPQEILDRLSWLEEAHTKLQGQLLDANFRFMQHIGLSDQPAEEGGPEVRPIFFHDMIGYRTYGVFPGEPHYEVLMDQQATIKRLEAENQALNESNTELFTDVQFWKADSRSHRNLLTEANGARDKLIQRNQEAEALLERFVRYEYDVPEEEYPYHDIRQFLDEGCASSSTKPHKTCSSDSTPEVTTYPADGSLFDEFDDTTTTVPNSDTSQNSGTNPENGGNDMTELPDMSAESNAQVNSAAPAQVNTASYNDPADVCANCRFWQPRDEEDREPWEYDDSGPLYEDIPSPCGVRPPTEWLKTEGILLVEPPHTAPTMWCRFHEPFVSSYVIHKNSQTDENENPEPYMPEVASCCDKLNQDEPLVQDDVVQHVGDSALVERVAKAIASELGPADWWEDSQIEARAAIREVADSLEWEFAKGRLPSWAEIVDWLRAQL